MIQIQVGFKHKDALRDIIDRYDSISIHEDGQTIVLSGATTLSELEIFFDQVKILISYQLYERIVEEVRRWIAG